MSWGEDELEDRRMAWECELCGNLEKDIHNIGTIAGEEDIFVCDYCYDKIPKRRLNRVVGIAVRKRHQQERQEKIKQKELRRAKYEELKKEFGLSKGT